MYQTIEVWSLYKGVNAEYSITDGEANSLVQVTIPYFVGDYYLGMEWEKTIRRCTCTYWFSVTSRSRKRIFTIFATNSALNV